MELILSSFTAIVCLLLAIFVYQNNRKSATNAYFALFIFFLGLYNIFNYLSLHSVTNQDSFFWAKMILFSAIPAGPMFYFFVRTFPSSKFVFNIKLQTFLIIWVLLNILLVDLNLVFQSVKIVSGSPQIEVGPAVASFGMLQIVSILAGLYSLISKYIKSTGVLKLQLSYITLGISVSFALSLLSTVILPLLFGYTTLIPISPLYFLVGGISIAYSIMRHRLLDIRLIVARSIAYSLLLLILASLYGFGVFITSALVTGQSLKLADLLTTVIYALGIAFTFQPLRIFLEKLTDSIFYKNAYSPERFLAKTGHIMASVIELDKIVDLVAKSIQSEMKISSSTVILLNQFQTIWQKDFNRITNTKLASEDVRKIIFSLTLKDQQEMLLFDDMEEGEVKELLRDQSIAAVLLLKVEEKNIGLLALGQKESGEIYSQKDIDVFKVIIPELAVAIKNALSFEEIKKFNVTLKEEVELATKNLSDANIRLQELDQLKDEFVSVASHELRTPMTAIKSYLWMAINGKGGELNEKQHYYLDRAYMSTERLIKLVNDMLNVSRIEAGRVSLTVDKVDLNTLSEEVIAEVKPRGDELGLTIKLNRFDNLPAVIADSDKIKEVLINFIGNSLKFTPKGGLIQITFEEKNGMVIAHVSDNGRGIQKEDQAKLFEKFGLIKGSYATNSSSEGTGLGLYICKSIIKMHKGEIWAYSEGRDKGAVFSFSLKEYNQKDLELIKAEQEGKEGKEIIQTGV